MGSGNLHNKSPALRWRRHRGNSSSDADKSLHASGVKGSTLPRAATALAAGRAASLLARNVALMSTTGL